jgi:hypothetical protein
MKAAKAVLPLPVGATATTERWVRSAVRMSSIIVSW